MSFRKDIRKYIKILLVTNYRSKNINSQNLLFSNKIF